MEAFVIGFAAGTWLCQLQSNLQGALWPCVLALLLVLPAQRLRGAPRGLMIAVLAALLGFALGNWRAEQALSHRLAESLERQDMVLTGEIQDLPQAFERGWRFQFRVLGPPPGVPDLLLLSWYTSGKAAPGANSLPRAGETWRVQVRLRQVHGNFNPHGFDYEAWAFERGIGASGYVRSQGDNRRLSASPRRFSGWLAQWRDRIRERFERVLPDSPWRGILIALVVGDQAAIPRSQWQIFSQTGVTHLMSISGLHVTMIAALAGGLLSAGWRRVSWLALRIPAQKAAAVAGLAGAGAYVLLAGCGVPALRTFYMLLVVSLSLWSGRSSAPRQILLAALFLVLLLDPWAVLAAGFWLSFLAVAALMLVSTGGKVKSRLREWWRAQWAVSLLSLPILLGLFQQFSLVSPVANALAIPLVSLVITPLALLFALLRFPSLAECADFLLGGLMQGLGWLAAQPFAVWQQAAPPWWLVLLASLGFAWSLLPRGIPARQAGLLCLLPLLSWQAPRPADGEAEVTVLDVGQGLAVHVRTARHDLIYDTGPQYSPELDAGLRIVLPYLRAEGAGHLDQMVISHDDNDHSGGADSILAGLPVRSIRTSLASGHAVLQGTAAHGLCQAGERWAWDGVGFEFLHPQPDWPTHSDNDASCVLRVVSEGASLLLVGDVEAMAERQLLASAGDRLAADILVAPHHGSRSSSHADFVQAVRPQEVVFSNGYLNRFGHPAPEVVTRYEAMGARSWRTDQSGALRIVLSRRGYAGPVAERALQRRYWHDD